MTGYTVILSNTTSGCGDYVEESFSISACTNYIIKLNNDSNALGPFEILISTSATTQTITGITDTQLISGYSLSLGC